MNANLVKPFALIIAVTVTALIFALLPLFLEADSLAQIRATATPTIEAGGGGSITFSESPPQAVESNGELGAQASVLRNTTMIVERYEPLLTATLTITEYLAGTIPRQPAICLMKKTTFGHAEINPKNSCNQSPLIRTQDLSTSYF